MFWIPAIAGSIFLIYIFAWTLIHIGAQFDKSLEKDFMLVEMVLRRIKRNLGPSLSKKQENTIMMND